MSGSSKRKCRTKTKNLKTRLSPGFFRQSRQQPEDRLSPRKVPQGSLRCPGCWRRQGSPLWKGIIGHNNSALCLTSVEGSDRRSQKFWLTIQRDPKSTSCSTVDHLADGCELGSCRGNCQEGTHLVQTKLSFRGDCGLSKAHSPPSLSFWDNCGCGPFFSTWMRANMSNTLCCRSGSDPGLGGVGPVR